MDEFQDSFATARAAMDQMGAWYRLFAEGLADIQRTLLAAGVDEETTRRIVANQHKRLIEMP